MERPLSVGELNNQLKSFLETTFSQVYVEGEISNLTFARSGHIYFSIKEKDAVVSCVIFKSNAQKLKFGLEIGLKIVIKGKITLYSPRGAYQLLCNIIEPSGQGALALAYEQLKTKLQIEGYFDTSRKKELPLFPHTLFVVTSNSGAAIQDMKKIVSQRWPLCKMVLLPTLVQGLQASSEICKNLQKADALALKESKNGKKPLIIFGRGGGSLEDLWPFNEEEVARTVYSLQTPCISAVGHESDFLISDFVADKRASTPSNAIEIATPDINQVRQYIDTRANELTQAFKRVLQYKIRELENLYKHFELNSFQREFDQTKQIISSLRLQLKQTLYSHLNHKSSLLHSLNTHLSQLNPHNKVKKGYVQISDANKVIDLEDLKPNQSFYLHTPKKVVKAQVIDIQEN